MDLPDMLQQQHLSRFLSSQDEQLANHLENQNAPVYALSACLTTRVPGQIGSKQGKVRAGMCMCQVEYNGCIDGERPAAWSFWDP